MITRENTTAPLIIAPSSKPPKESSEDCEGEGVGVGDCEDGGGGGRVLK